MALESAREAVFRDLDPRDGDGLFPEEREDIRGLSDGDKRSLEAMILERVQAAGAPDFRQLLALEALGSTRAAPLLREAFAGAGHKRGDWKDLEFAVALWRVAGDEKMLDYVLGELSALFVTRRRAAARALAGARCLKAADALHEAVSREGPMRLRVQALVSLTEQIGIDAGIRPEDPACGVGKEAFAQMLARADFERRFAAYRDSIVE